MVEDAEEEEVGEAGEGAAEVSESYASPALSRTARSQASYRRGFSLSLVSCAWQAPEEEGAADLEQHEAEAGEEEEVAAVVEDEAGAAGALRAPRKLLLSHTGSRVSSCQREKPTHS